MFGQRENPAHVVRMLTGALRQRLRQRLRFINKGVIPCHVMDMVSSLEAIEHASALGRMVVVGVCTLYRDSTGTLPVDDFAAIILDAGDNPATRLVVPMRKCFPRGPTYNPGQVVTPAFGDVFFSDSLYIHHPSLHTYTLLDDWEQPTRWFIGTAG